MKRLERAQEWLERINKRYGDIGSVFTIAFWLVVLAMALHSMLFDF